MGNVSVYNPLNLKVIDEYKKLHDSMITALTSLNGFIYSCGVDKVIKKVKKNDEK